MLSRRHFNISLALALGAIGARSEATDSVGLANTTAWTDIERSVKGRLGIAVLDTANGAVHGHRLDERFPMCSTFKWLAAALVLNRVDARHESLDRRIVYGREALVSYSPVTEKHLGRGMTLGELCEATVTLSDNAAANLILASSGGPAALTRYARTLGDTMTRLDRTEPALNEATPGDPRDTTTPRAMAGSLRAAVLGDALSAKSRAQLAQWLVDTKTGTERLRKHLPAGWRAGDKTGTGARGTTNDVAVFWPPDRAPIVVATYLTDTSAPAARCNAALAQVGRLAAKAARQ